MINVAAVAPTDSSAVPTSRCQPNASDNRQTSEYTSPKTPTATALVSARRYNESVLEAVPGLGPAKRRALLKHFGGLQGIMRAGVADLTQVSGIGATLAFAAMIRWRKFVANGLVGWSMVNLFLLIFGLSMSAMGLSKGFTLSECRAGRSWS